MKIDVCLVTKNPDIKTIKGLEYVPVHDLITERSRPLGLARMKAIQKVKTEWFAFIDDDVEIGPDWFRTVYSSIDPEVGAVEGLLFDYGFGFELDRELNDKKISSYSSCPYELKPGERGKTHNVLIRTNIVRDWAPSRGDLSAFEDYEITQHILSKGYKWMLIPEFLGKHKKGWDHEKASARWGLEGRVKLFGWKSVAPDLCRSTIQILHIMLTRDISGELKKHSIFVRVQKLLGALKILTAK